MISDNVFVATVYINELEAQFRSCNIVRKDYDLLAVAVNSGTNVLSVATPNGQAAFLFLLTSALAPKLDLTYVRMVRTVMLYFICSVCLFFLLRKLILPSTTKYFVFLRHFCYVSEWSGRGRLLFRSDWKRVLPTRSFKIWVKRKTCTHQRVAKSNCSSIFFSYGTTCIHSGASDALCTKFRSQKHSRSHSRRSVTLLDHRNTCIRVTIENNFYCSKSTLVNEQSHSQ